MTAARYLIFVVLFVIQAFAANTFAESSDPPPLEDNVGLFLTAPLCSLSVYEADLNDIASVGMLGADAQLAFGRWIVEAGTLFSEATGYWLQLDTRGGIRFNLDNSGGWGTDTSTQLGLRFVTYKGEEWDYLAQARQALTLYRRGSGLRFAFRLFAGFLVKAKPDEYEGDYGINYGAEIGAQIGFVL